MNVLTETKRLATGVIDILVPRYCAVCGEQLSPQEHSVCTSCMMSLPRTGYQHVEHSNVEKWFWTLFPVERAVSFFHYDAQNMRKLVWEGKYNGHPKVGYDLAVAFAEEIKATSDFFEGIDAIVPLPLHWLRQMKRGYNQSHYIARGISRATGIPVYANVARRCVNNKSQTKLNLQERRENVKNIFKLKKSHRITGKHILVVDDVLTTGATIASLAKELAKAGNVRISILTLAVAARTPVPATYNDEPDHMAWGMLLLE